MGYAALVDKQLSNAFLRVKDLASDALFTKSTSANFNFNSGQLAETQAPPIRIKLVVTNEVTKSSTVTRTVMAKAADIVAFTLYDTITLDGVIWKIGDVLKQSGKIWVFNIFREVQS